MNLRIAMPLETAFDGFGALGAGTGEQVPAAAVTDGPLRLNSSDHETWEG
jgi:hypothetical protein